MSFYQLAVPLTAVFQGLMIRLVVAVTTS